MLALEAIAPGETDRAAFVGQTGSGKTTLAEQMCRLRPWVVAFDPKGMLEWDGYEIHTRLAPLTKAKGNRLTYRPVFEELDDEDTVDLFFEWVYERRHTTLYVDEVFAIAEGDRSPWHFRACLTRGRERGIAVYLASQRPSRIPQVMLSESEHVYLFNLKLPQDRERMEDVTGLEESRLILPKHEFYYVAQSGEPRGPLKLRLGKRSGSSGVWAGPGPSDDTTRVDDHSARATVRA